MKVYFKELVAMATMRKPVPASHGSQPSNGIYEIGGVKAISRKLWAVR